MYTNNINSLFKSLNIEKGITSIVGAGGKTSTMLTLGKQAAVSYKTILSTSTKIYIPDDIPLIENELMLKKQILYAFDNKNLIVCGKRLSENPSKITSFENKFQTLSKLCDYLFIEADGAKQFPVKIPGFHEPVIHDSTKNVIATVGIDCLGKTISEVAFRPEQMCSFLREDMDHRFSVDDICSIITDTNGLKKDVSATMRYIVFINKVDSEKLFGKAMEIKDALRSKGLTDVCILSYLIGGFYYDCSN